MTSPEVAAQHRAMPLTRLVDGGMAPADARSLLARTAEGEAWSAVAAELAGTRAAGAHDAQHAGHLQTARLWGGWAVGAAVFAQMAENTDTPAKLSAYRRLAQLVGTLAAAADPQVERIELPHRGGRLVGWLCLPPGGRADGTVVLWGGLSGWGATYLSTARALTARGLACLLAEGPGQGESRLEHGLHVDERVVEGFARFLDAVAADGRLGGPVGIQGNSFGGLFAAHLAAADPRVAACVVNGAPATPPLPTFRTARAQLTAALGTTDDDRLLEVLGRLRFDPVRQPIACPVLVLHGGADALIPEVAEQQPFADAAGDRGQLLVWPDGEHTLYNHAAERDAVVGDWFADHLLADGSVASA